MAKQDEISSTEKLLDLIRTKSEKFSDLSDSQSIRSTGSDKEPVSVKKIPYRKKISVGVDIGPSDIRLAAVGLTVDKRPLLIDYKCIPIDPDLKSNALRFSRFLRTRLAEFIGFARKVDIWTTVSTARVETRYIRIPKVPPKQIANAVYWTYKKKSILMNIPMFSISKYWVRSLSKVCDGWK